MKSGDTFSRRAFMKLGALTAVMFGIRAGGIESAGAQTLPMLDEKDPTAAALGYKADATQVDKAKFPKYAAGQNCAGCQLYQGKPGTASGPCSIFAGKAVSAKGWCSAYTKKG